MGYPIVLADHKVLLESPWAICYLLFGGLLFVLSGFMGSYGLVRILTSFPFSFQVH